METARHSPSPTREAGRFEALRDPLRVRALTVVVIWAAGAIAVNASWSEQSRIAAQFQSLIARRALMDKIDERRERLEKLSPLLPRAGCDVTAWLERVRQAAADAGLESIAVRYKEVGKVTIGGHRLLGMDVEFDGPFQGATAFVHWLETSQPRPRPAVFRMERAPGKSGKLSSRVSFQVLLADDGERAAGPERARR